MSPSISRPPGFFFETLSSGMLGFWQPGWSPYLSLATPVDKPWFPTVFGMYGAATSTTRLGEWAKQVTRDKSLTRTLATVGGFRFPEHQLVAWGDWRAAAKFLQQFPSIVVKPKNSGQSRGVSMGIRSEEELSGALGVLEASGFEGDSYLVEEEIAGPNYRILASRKRTLAMYQRTPVRVTGDGRSTISQLIEMRNSYLSEKWEDKPQIKVDSTTLNWLRRQGYALSDVPMADAEVILSPICARSFGSQTIDVLDEAHQSILAAGPEIVSQVPGADILGIDVILPKGHKVDRDAQDAVLLEVGGGSALDAVSEPDSGQPRNPHRMILEDLAEDAGIKLHDAPKSQRVAIRTSFPEMSASQLGDLLGHLPEVSVSTEQGVLGTIQVLSGPNSDLKASLSLIGQYVGQIVGLSVTTNPRLTTQDIDRVLTPPPLVPRDHSVVLSSASSEIPTQSARIH